MKRFELTIVGISLGITCFVSALFGLAGSSIIGTFWGWFWISLLIQFIGFVLYNSFLIQRDNTLNQQVEIESLDKLSKFTVKLTCAYCQQANAIPIQLNQRNTFKCESCNQVNGVSMQFMATTLTTPLETVKIPVESSNSIEFKVSA
jgi:hypothetical protein